MMLLLWFVELLWLSGGNGRRLEDYDDRWLPSELMVVGWWSPLG